MSSKFSLARAAAVALVAIGSVASLGTDAFAVNRTWTGNAPGSGNAGRWGTAAVYNSNWSQATPPTSADTGVFSSNSNRTITTLPDLLPIGDFSFSGNGNNTFSNTTGSSIVISGNGSTPNVGISSTGAGTQTFNGNVVVNAPLMTFQTTGGPLAFGGGGLNLNGNYLKVAGNTTQGNLGSTVAGAIYEAVSGTQTLTFDNANANVARVIVNGGVVSGDGNSATDLTVSGGTYLGGGTYKNVANNSGLISNGAGDTLNTTNFVQGSGGSILMNAESDLTSSRVNGNFELNGAMELQGVGLGTSTFAYGTTWALFSGANFTSGSASPLNDASNFSAFAMTPASSGSPYYGTFTKYGQEWTSPQASDGTYLVFQAASGNLVVVPEPSTMVFAGLGVAMSGWTMWKKRRLGKLLAAKAG